MEGFEFAIVSPGGSIKACGLTSLIQDPPARSFMEDVCSGEQRLWPTHIVFSSDELVSPPEGGAIIQAILYSYNLKRRKGLLPS